MSLETSTQGFTWPVLTGGQLPRLKTALTTLREYPPRLCQPWRSIVYFAFVAHHLHAEVPVSNLEAQFTLGLY